jgi:malonyl-CoA O-methyltransferase
VPTRDKEESKAIKEFARFAHKYDTYNVIQADVARTLVKKLPIQKYDSILDMGCGSGEVYKNIKKQNISFDRFVALDSSLEMLALHPSDDNIKKIVADFNSIKTYKILENLPKETLLLSSSSLQWGKDLDFIFSQLSQRCTKAFFAIFTANTFKTLHKVADIASPIYSFETIKTSIEKYYHASFELKEYKLEFKSVRDMFNYIKKSGVSGGERQLSYREIKRLMDEYPLNYLEFEVVFISATSLACLQAK